MLLALTVKRFELQFQKCYGKSETELNIVELDTVHGHKYSSPSIFYLLYISYKTTFFQKNILKPSLGRFL
jgi:hypothetical protein